ncbi:hypothetical protein P152DRAFT_401169 [Eremomyces bilateralis CBS 781.70]|uniref:RRM domain-containing protein n=1 Tax=Eremomyces bilateralis CBS 781.70 TaxID=1392243 RepID=A0A6G1FX69_9PEZI|nr:uncharacterized protein P152DRAFT_401169 [Eremomyces bilateralis CBS 781.70]KAF1810374.1 hypothetical protein P152DRAFT_401169 [Eremomyces bilateralis CBS 781.70]
MINSRRESISSNDQDVPPTPVPYGAGSGQVAVFDRSTPNVALTPSPTNLLAFNLVTPVKQTAPVQLPLHLQLLLNKEPTIPRAIPAPSSPVKPLDRALENKNGETNVYIRGLHPETTDDMLYAYGARFGEIQSSKAIIDMKSNQCKGFGFIKYHNYEDAEGCIRGFHHLGYECSFARESFYSKLKKFSDEGNTNLYVSNIPRNMNEHELSEIFAPHHVISSRILRSSDGHGRGVGFAR